MAIAPCLQVVIQNAFAKTNGAGSIAVKETFALKMLA
jgi:hypothetical protein